MVKIKIYPITFRLCICNFFNEAMCNHGYQGNASFSNNGRMQLTDGCKICRYPEREGTEKGSTTSNKLVELIWNQSQHYSSGYRKPTIFSGKIFHNRK